ncbi:hypothetical protein [Treponema zioleckii]|nr:hypothetical protein [Treponema zioleckii]
MAQTMLDFDWNNARRESGWAELSKPSWDKKLSLEYGLIQDFRRRK